MEKLLYHHARPLEHSPLGVVKQAPERDEDFAGAFGWLAKEVGFYPLFMSVGVDIKDLYMTGYHGQWFKILSFGPNGREYRQKGEIDNRVLFSFPELPPKGVFMDYGNWHLALNSSYNGYQLTTGEKRSIFKFSWNVKKWLDYAQREPHSVQLVVPELDLRKAERVWVRNKKSKRSLEDLGFKGVEVRRLPITFPD